MSQDIPEMGRLAAQIVIDRLANAGEEPSTHVLPTTLRLRGSEKLWGLGLEGTLPG